MITQDQFYCYLGIQQSAVVNMYDTRQVSQLSYGTLSINDVRDIMRNYAIYKNQYCKE